MSIDKNIYHSHPFAVHTLSFKDGGRDLGEPLKFCEIVHGKHRAIRMVEDKRGQGVCAWLVALPV